MSDKNHGTPRRDASRRDFLTTAAAGATGAGLGLSTPGSQASAVQDASRSSAQYDVVVVGAGVSGIYAAYRLASAKPGDLKRGANSALAKILEQNGSLRVAVYEYSDRKGGRLRSVKVPLPDSTKDQPKGFSYLAEFGGFRFQREMHIVWDTASKLLGLTDEPFGYEKNANPLLLRRVQFTFDELATGKANKFGTPAGGGVKGWKTLPYDLTDDEYEKFRYKGPDATNQGLGAIDGIVSNAAIPGYDELSKSYSDGFMHGSKTGDYSQAIAASNQYEAAKQTSKVGGRPLVDWGYWALRRAVLSQEAVNLLEDSGGYNEEAQAGNLPWSLDEGFYFLSEPTEDMQPNVNTAAPNSWRHITEGYDAIPKRLADKFEQAGGQIFLKHQLIGFDKTDSGGYSLTFFKREQGGSTTQAQAVDNPNNVTVSAQAIILALPKRALELVNQNNFFFTQPSVLSLLYGSVIPVYALRLFMAYDKAWWHEKFPEIVNGRSTTDLGVRQFYYWHVEDTLQGKYQGPALMLASYSSGSAEAYRRTLQSGPKFDEFPGGLASTGPRPASSTMANQAASQLSQVVQAEGGAPYYAHFQNWTKDPWGAGWHSWKTGQKYVSLIPKIRQPLPDENIYVVGECYSDKPGWVWGALNTSEALVQCNIGLKWPDFLTKPGTWLGPGTKWLQPGESDPCL